MSKRVSGQLPPRKIAPPVRFRVWYRVRIGAGGNFPRGNCLLSGLVHFSEAEVFKTGVHQSVINHQKFLIIFETKMLENFNLLLAKLKAREAYGFSRSSFCRSSRPEVFQEKGLLRNVVKFTGKHLYQSSFLIKLQDLSLQLY